MSLLVLLHAISPITSSAATINFRVISIPNTHRHQCENENSSLKPAGLFKSSFHVCEKTNNLLCTVETNFSIFYF